MVVNKSESSVGYSVFLSFFVVLDKHPDQSAARPPESGWAGIDDGKPSTIRITYIDAAPDGWRKQWEPNNDTIVYVNAQRNETVASAAQAAESNRKFDAVRISVSFLFSYLISFVWR